MAKIDRRLWLYQSIHLGKNNETSSCFSSAFVIVAEERIN